MNDITDIVIDYVNYNPLLHKNFPVLKYCKIFSKKFCCSLYKDKKNIYNVVIKNIIKPFNDITDDIGFDDKGRYILISIGEWRHCSTGDFISNDEFFDLDDLENSLYEYVSINIKLYTEKEYRICYHNNNYDYDIKLSLIPYNMINFGQKDSITVYNYE